MATVRYPSEFSATPNTDYIKIESIRRNYGGTAPVTGTATQASALGQYKPVSDSKGTSTVMLNMPQRVAESFSQSYRNASLGPEASQILSGQMSMANALNMTGDILKRLVENYLMDQSVSALGKLGASSLSDNSILSATSGIIYNPMMEVLYDGPQFRTFNFQFMLLAKSQVDAQNIFKIVKFFQWCSAPALSGEVQTQRLTGAIATANVVGGLESAAAAATQALTGNFTGAIQTAATGLGKGITTGLGNLAVAGESLFNPNTRFITQPPLIQLTYMRGSERHPYLNQIKPCVINNLEVNYTPTGNYTVLNNFDENDVSTTVATTITLSLTEIRTIYQDDYSDSGFKDIYEG